MALAIPTIHSNRNPKNQSSYFSHIFRPIFLFPFLIFFLFSFFLAHFSFLSFTTSWPFSISLSLSLSLPFFLSFLFPTTDLVIVATFYLIFATFTLVVYPLVATHHHSWSSLLHTTFIVMDVSPFLSYLLRSAPCHPFCFTLGL